MVRWRMRWASAEKFSDDIVSCLILMVRRLKNSAPWAAFTRALRRWR
jgi:hypothetical protein